MLMVINVLLGPASLDTTLTKPPTCGLLRRSKRNEAPHGSKYCSPNSWKSPLCRWALYQSDGAVISPLTVHAPRPCRCHCRVGPGAPAPRGTQECRLAVSLTQNLGSVRSPHPGTGPDGSTLRALMDRTGARSRIPPARRHEHS